VLSIAVNIFVVSSPDIIGMIKSRRMKLAGHVTRMGEERCVQSFDEDLEVDGRITLKWMFRNWDGNMDWIELAWDRDR